MGRPDPTIRQAILDYLRLNHPSAWRHWFEEIEPVQIVDGTLKLLVREPVQLRYLQHRCAEAFTEAVQAVTGRLLAVRFVSDQEANAAAGPASGGGEAGIGPDEMLLSPDYTFEHFVIGPGNRLAHAAAVAVARKPGGAYNPFFIHGGVGLGKTHLLQAICQETLRCSPAFRIHYTSCDNFQTQFIDAVKAGDMTSFRHRYRNVDMLVIDDIHDLSKRNRTQEEFFHTFNTLQQAGKQIVLSSDAAPAEVPYLEERLISRFNSGLVAAIDRPCYETRVEILKSKAKMRGEALPDDVAAYVAARIDTNIRELEGAITRIQHLASLDREPITLALAKRALNDAEEVGRAAQTTVQDIIDAITEYYGVKLTDLLSKRRHKSIALPRQVGMWLARKHTRFSLEEIGGYFGGRDHTTVMHAVRTIERRRNEDGALGNDLSRLEHRLTGESVGRSADAETVSR